MADAIRWKDGALPGSHTGYRGYLGDLTAPLWTIEYGILRDDGWLLYCKLPGIRERVTVESVEAGQVRAEAQLRAFLRKIRADFVDDDGELVRRNAAREASDAGA